jgi:hypothetical protein
LVIEFWARCFRIGFEISDELSGGAISAMESVEELGFIIAVEVFEAKEFDSPGGYIEWVRFHCDCRLRVGANLKGESCFGAMKRGLKGGTCSLVNHLCITIGVVNESVVAYKTVKEVG